MAITEDDRKFISSRARSCIDRILRSNAGYRSYWGLCTESSFRPQKSTGSSSWSRHAESAAGLDTPVVLVGGSMNLQSGRLSASPETWSTDTHIRSTTTLRHIKSRQ